MDKKDLNGNENLENSSTTEELNTSENINEGTEVEASAAEEPVNTKKEETAPVMNKVSKSGNSTPPASPAGSKVGNKVWMIASIVLAAALIIVLIVQKDDSKTAVATVNGTKITKGQLYDKLVELGGESTLQSMITSELIDQEAKKANVTVTEKDIDAEIEDLKAQFGGEAAFNAALSQSSMTVEDLRAQMPMQVKLRKILEPQVTVTDEEIQEYYDTNKASFSEEEQVRASHILVKTKEEADEILKQLKEGADFAELAKEKSADTGSAENGGDLDFFKRGDMVAEFSDAAFSLKVGEISDAVKSDYGYHIIKVTDHKDAKDYTLEEKKEEIRKTLVSQKVSALSSSWMADTTANAKITNTLTDNKNDAEATTEPSKEPSANAEAGNGTAE